MKDRTMIYQNEHFYIEKEEHELPWVKIFTKTPYKELTDLPQPIFNELWSLYAEVETIMREYFQPDKINMASFANMLPRVHLHVIARYSDDAYFPNPVWGEKLRQGRKIKEDFGAFYALVQKRLKEKEEEL